MTSPRQVFPPLDPITLLELANQLSNGNSAAIRSAGDRAYYAAFLASRDLLSNKGYITPHYGTIDHDYISKQLKRPEILGSFGDRELQLRRARNEVTYQTGPLMMGGRNVRPLQWMVETAQEIIDRVTALPNLNS